MPVLNRSKIILTIVTIIAILAFIGTAIAGVALGLRNRHRLVGYYDSAVDCMINEDWDGAIYWFEQIPNITNWGTGDEANAAKLYEYSKNMITYKHAIEIFESENYHEAYDIFKSLNGFKDSKIYEEKCWEEAER